MYLCIYLSVTHMTVEVGKSKICRANWQIGNSCKGWCFILKSKICRPDTQVEFPYCSFEAELLLLILLLLLLLPFLLSFVEISLTYDYAIRLVTHPSPHVATVCVCVCVCVCVVRTFTIFSLSNFQIYDTALLIVVTMLSITFPQLVILWLVLCTPGPPLPISPTIHPLPLATINLFSVSLKLVFFRFHILLLGVYHKKITISKRYLYPSVHCIFIYIEIIYRIASSLENLSLCS